MRNIIKKKKRKVHETEDALYTFGLNTERLVERIKPLIRDE